MDHLAPLVGFSLSLALLLGALSVFTLILWATVPFTLFGLRRQADRHTEILLRIEKALLAAPAPAVAPEASPAVELAP